MRGVRFWQRALRLLAVAVVAASLIQSGLARPAQSAPGWPRLPSEAEVEAAAATYWQAFLADFAREHGNPDFVNHGWDPWRDMAEADKVVGCRILFWGDARLRSVPFARYPIASLAYDTTARGFAFRYVTDADPATGYFNWANERYTFATTPEGIGPCTAPTPTVSVRAVLGYDVPLNVAQDVYADAPPLRLVFASGRDDVPIETITIESQQVQNAEVMAMLGNDTLFIPTTAGMNVDQPTFTFSPPEPQVSVVYDRVNLYALSRGSLPAEVDFRATVDLRGGERVPLQFTVRIDAAYNVGLLRQGPIPASPPPGAPRSYDGRLRLGETVIDQGTQLKGLPGQVLRMPVGALVLVRFLDGTAGVMNLPEGVSVWEMGWTLGYTAETDFADPDNRSIIALGLSGQAADKLQGQALKLLVKRAAGPVGIAIDVAGQLVGQAGSQLIRLRLRSAVGLSISADAISVRGFDGAPAVLQPNGAELTLAPGELTLRQPDGSFAPPVSDAVDPLTWVAGESVEPPWVVPTAVATATPAAGTEGLLVEINTRGTVRNGPPAAPSTFTLDRDHFITRLRTYHWNDGRGATPGTVALRGADGRTYGPWPATGEPGSGGVPNAYWNARPQLVLPAGAYTVIDSDPATWANNQETGGRGMIWVYGYAATGGASPPTPTAVGSGGSGQTATADQVRVGALVRFESSQRPASFLRHQAGLAEMTPLLSDQDRADATFRVVAGLADAGKFSLESLSQPGYYLRHQDFRLKLQRYADDGLYKADTTFTIVPGLADASNVSIASHNYTSRYLRERDGHLYLEAGTDAAFRRDATFRLYLVPSGAR